MPNWCTTFYIITGDKKTLHLFNRKLNQLRSRKESLLPNGFGKLWCGNIAYLLGEKDPANFGCRGEVTDYQISIDGSVLCVGVMSAWAELSDLRDLVQEKYPDVDIWFQSEEPGCIVYETNDPDGKYFPEKYVLNFYDDDEGVCINEYFKTLEEVSSFVSENILDGKPAGKTEAAIEAVLHAYQESHSNVSYMFERFRLVD